MKLPTKLLASLERHRGLVTLIGTFIVFLTFIFRDVLREWARAERGKYANAQASFELKTSIMDLKDSIQKLAFLVLSEKAYFEDPNKQRHAHWEIANERTDDLKLLIENVDDLLQTLPSGKANGVADPLRSFRSRREELGDRLGSEPPGDSVEASDKLIEDVSTEELEIGKAGKKVVKSLKHESDLVEGYDHAFDSCSFAFYALGLVFAVTGQLLGIKNDASGS